MKLPKITNKRLVWIGAIIALLAFTYFPSLSFGTNIYHYLSLGVFLMVVFSLFFFILRKDKKYKKIYPFNKIIVIVVLFGLLYFVFSSVMPFFKIPIGCHAQTLVLLGPSDWPECVVGAAKDKNDIRMCKHAGILWSDCVRSIAYDNVNTCFVLKNKEFYSDLLYDNEKDYCIAGVAEVTEDPLVCQLIKDWEREDACYNRIIKKFSYYTKTCRLIPNQDKRDECLNISANRNKDVTICYEISRESMIDECLLSLGVCDNAVTIVNKTECVEKFRSETKNIEVCDTIIDNELKKECIMSITQTPEDIDFCDRLESSESSARLDDRDDCIRELAWQTKETNLCVEIEHLNWKVYCVRGLVGRNDDISHCEILKEIRPEAYEDCLKILDE